jgi:rhodanese-related sulfurtransferase
MRYLKTFNPFFSLILVLIIVSCSGGGNKPKQADPAPAAGQKSATLVIGEESQKLLKYLDQSGDYVNGRNFPSLIKASAVLKELDGKIKIIDLRDPVAFSKGHIKGAVNVEFSKIPDYFINLMKPFEFDKIVIVCNSGQYSSYTTSLLRLMGYGNVYALRWGMSGWNKDFASDAWMTALSDKYEGKLELIDNARGKAVDFPQLNTGKSTGEEIMTDRFNSLFSAGYSDAFITSDLVFEQSQNYYTINFERKDKYDAGHIPGAVRYKTNGTLGIVAEMQSIPADREVAVYCGTGHNSGFVTAYLRLFGYNAKTILYGNNSFMHSKMVQDKKLLSWLPFTEEEIENYPYVKN